LDSPEAALHTAQEQQQLLGLAFAIMMTDRFAAAAAAVVVHVL
jgi:hypothetical protein